MRKIILITGVLLRFAQSAFAAPLFDAISTDVGESSATASVAHTVGGGCANSVLLAWVVWYDATAVSITGVSTSAGAMSFVNAINTDNSVYRIELWQRAGVSGSQTVTATFSDVATSATVRAISYCSVDQDTPLGTSATGLRSIDGNSPKTTVSSAAGELVVDGLLTLNSAVVTVDPTQTEQGSAYDHGGYETIATSQEGGAASVSMDWTLSDTFYWASIGVPLMPYSAPPAAPSGNVMVITVQ